MTPRSKSPMAWRVVLLGILAVAMFAVPAQAANATSFSGRATVVDVDVNNLDGSALLNFVLADTGPLPAAGGSLEDEVLNANVNQAPLTLTASVLRAKTNGSGSTAESIANAKDLDLALAGLLAVSSTTLRSIATASCGANGAVVSGDSIIEDLTINGTNVTVTGEPNQHVDLGPIDLFINEQDSTVTPDGSYGEITVTALRITVRDPITNALLAEVILSRAHADVTCPTGDDGPDGGIGGPCLDPAYYGIFDNTEGDQAYVFRFRYYNGNGLQTITKTVPAGAIFRTWEKWVKAFTTMRVGYFNPDTGRWVNLETRQSVKGNYPPCDYQRGFTYPTN